MTKTNTRSRIVSILLVLMMLLTMLPITALAASPDASNVFVDGGKNFYNPGRLYYKNNDPENAFTGTSTDFNAAYDPATGTLTLKDYNGKGITVGGVECSDITVVLKGTNTINGSLTNDVGGDITITSESGGTLSITNTLSGGKAIGIETGLSASYTTGNVTIKGDAKVTINMTNNGMSTYEKAYGIYAKKNITISENASVDITCATPNNTTGGDNCNGLYAAKDVTIDTNGTIKIDVTKAGKDNGYSFGVYPMGTATLTKVGEMEVQWKKHATHSSYPGGAVYKGASLSDTDYAINEDTTNCYASYRFGTPRTVMVQDGQLTGPGVKYAKNSGYFLAGDNVNITPATKKGRSGEEIPFKEWTSSDVMLDKSATTASNSFTVPGKDVTVTAKHSPFVGTPTFTPTGTTGTEGTLTFKTVVKADGAYEGFRLVKEGNENNESSYIRINPGTTSTSSPYEYSCETNIYELDKGNYYVVAYLNNDYYLGEKFTVNYTAPVTTYTVSFDANGGTGTMADVTGISGEYTLPANGFTAPAGKQFKAWSVGGVEKAAGDKITVTANTTVTAVWEAIEYNVTVTGGTASVGAGTPITKATMGTTVTLIAGQAPAGQEFDKWVVNGVVVADANSATTTFVMPAGNVTAEATYKNAPHTHTFDQEIVKDAALKTAADCTHDAVYYKSCSCGAISTDDTDTFTAINSALGHAWPEEGSWSKDADKHWYECSRCHLKKDEAAHDYGDDDICDICTYDNSVPHTHNLTLVDENPATCTTPGNKAYYTCDGCDKWFEDTSGSVEITDKTSVILTANGHTPSDWKFDADNHWKECTVVGCGVIIEDSKAAHTASDWIIDTEATATTDGTKHKECTECGYVMETGTIPATGGGEHTHSYSSDWKSDSINHWHECSCGVKDDVAAHSFKWVVDKEATATKKGSKHEECKFCGYQRPAVEIPVTGSTTKPTDPTESNPNTGALDDVPQTGDNNNMILWIVLLLTSGLGVTITVVYSKRKKHAK